MSLQSDISAWQIAYDETQITTTHNPAYIGSILDTSGTYHTGGGIYANPPAAGLEYEIHDFNWYAGQGVPASTGYGGKYLLYSECGFSWDTTDIDSDNQYEFVTSGSLDTVYLGYNPFADTGAAPAEATLTAFNQYAPLLVISNFDVAVDYVAANVYGVTDGNSAIAASTLDGDGLLANPTYYESVTLNSAVIYDLAFDDTSEQVIEYILDEYLSGISGGAVDSSDTIADINTWLNANGSDVELEYVSAASGYGDGDSVISAAEAETHLNASACDLLMAA